MDEGSIFSVVEVGPSNGCEQALFDTGELALGVGAEGQGKVTSNVGRKALGEQSWERRGPALVLFSHGSTLCGAGRALYGHAERLRSTGEWAAVEVGFLNFSKPVFGDVVDDLVGRGYRTIVVVPYFLVAGKFVREDLAEEIARAGTRHPEVDFRVARAVGYDPALAEILWELARRASPPVRWRADLLAAAESCEGRADCPLYGRPPCRVRLEGEDVAQ